MPRLFLVRHAETGCGDRMQGWTDAHLNELGKAQVERLAQRMARESYQAVYCSDLWRACQTAGPLAGGRPLLVSAGLREINFGLWEDKTFEELTARFPAEVQQWQQDPVQVAPPMGESLRDIADRCASLAICFEPYASLVIVSHQTALQVLACRLLGMPLAHHWRLRFDHASLSVIDTYPEGAICSLLNDTHHLQGLE